MKKTLYLLSFLCGIIMHPISAQNNTEIATLQKKIATTFINQPDAVKVYLHELLKYSRQLSDSLLARSYNKLGVSCGQLEQADSTRYYFKKGIETATDSLMVADFYIDLGKSERNIANYDRAFKALEKARALYSKTNFQEGIAQVYVEMATIYNYKSEEGKAIEELKKAIQIFDSIGETQHILIAKQEMANAYNNTGKYVFAKDIYEDILPELKESEQELNYHFALFGYARCLVHLEEMEKAKRTYNKIIHFFDTTNNLKYYSFAMYKTAQIDEKLGQFETAILNYEKAFQGMAKIRSARLKQVSTDYLTLLTKRGKNKKALEVLRNIQDLGKQNRLSMNDRGKVRFMYEAVEVLEQNKLYKEAYTQLKKAMHLQDSIRQERNAIKIEEIQAKYQNQYLRKEKIFLKEKNQLLAEKNSAKRNVILLISLLTALIIITAFIIYRKQKQQAKLKEIALENMKQSKKMLKAKLEVETTLHEERQKTLEEKERELVGSSIKMAHLKNGVIAIIEDSSQSNTSMLKRRLRSLLGKENTWGYFIEKFVKVHPDFMEKIRTSYPSFSKNDLDFCALILLRLSNKEIATLLSISPESVITKKYRLRKKINLPTQENSLEEHLISFK